MMRISAKKIKAAIVCQAKGDVRYYLNGFNVNDKYIEATNGHVCVRMEHGVKRAKKGIYHITGKIPAKCFDVEFVVRKDFKLARFISESGEEIGLSTLKVIDGNFPDLNKVIPQNTTKKEDDMIPLINTRYMAYPEKMFKGKFISMKQDFFGGIKSIKITLGSNQQNHEYGNPIFIVMPARN